MNLGRKYSEEHRRKISIGQQGKRLSEETKRKIALAVQRGKYTWLKKQCKERDDYTCQVCGLRDPEIMEVDHILKRCERPDLMNELSNLVTLCPNCHRRKTNREIKRGYSRIV